MLKYLPTICSSIVFSLITVNASEINQEQDISAMKAMHPIEAQKEQKWEKIEQDMKNHDRLSRLVHDKWLEEQKKIQQQKIRTGGLGKIVHDKWLEEQKKIQQQKIRTGGLGKIGHDKWLEEPKAPNKLFLLNN